MASDITRKILIFSLLGLLLLSSRAQELLGQTLINLFMAEITQSTVGIGTESNHIWGLGLRPLTNPDEIVGNSTSSSWDPNPLQTIDPGLKQAKNFSWRKTAQRTVEVYRLCF